MSAMPKKDSRLLLAKFNEQLQPLYDLLREVEDIKLSPECLEPEPTDLDSIRGYYLKILGRISFLIVYLLYRLNKNNQRGSNEPWSGEATRNQGFAVEETRVDVNLDGTDIPDAIKPKDRPVWMTESTVVSIDPHNTESAESILQKAALSSTQPASSASSGSTTTTARQRKDNEDIMSVLLLHEKQQGKNNVAQTAVKGLAGGNTSDSSDDEREIENAVIRKYHLLFSWYLR